MAINWSFRILKNTEHHVLVGPSAQHGCKAFTVVSSIWELNLETTEQILHAVISQAGRGQKYVNLSTHRQLYKKKKKDKTDLEDKRGH